MQIDGQKRLMAALLVAGALAGCTVEPANSGLGTVVGTGGGGSKSSGSAGSTAGKGGSAGGGSGGGGGSAGSEVDASVDVSEAGPSDDASDAGAQTACFADDNDAGDAAAEDGCAALPYSNVLCTDGGAPKQPEGMVVCLAYAGAGLKASAFRQLRACLNALPAASPCSQAHFDAADACSANLYTHDTCAVPPETIDGGTYGCAEIAVSCPGTDGGTDIISIERCNSWLDPWNAEVRRTAVECYLDPSSPGENCRDKFDKCIPFPALD